MFSFVSLKNSLKNITINIFAGVFLLLTLIVFSNKAYGIYGGPELQVNTYTDNDQLEPCVAAFNNGFVVAWGSDGQDGSGYGVYGQIFNALGLKIGDEFQINTYTNNDQAHPSVAFLKNSNFVVVWSSGNQDGDNWGVYGQIFDAVGNKVGSEFGINTYTTDQQSSPVIATLDNGNFVVTWHSRDQDGSGLGIYAQIFDETGAKIGAEFQVNTHTTYDQLHPFVAAFNNGSFIVIWESVNQDGSGLGVYGQIFNSSGTKIGNELAINTYTIGEQTNSKAAILSNNNFVVAWQSYGQDGSEKGVYGQIFSTDGTKIGNEFKVNAYINNNQETPSVASFHNGYFIIVWQSEGQDGSGYGIYAQIFDGFGNKVGNEFQVNTHSNGNQIMIIRGSSLAVLSNNSFVVTWQSEAQDGSGIGVYARIFRVPFICSDNGKLCADGVEQALNYIEDIPETFEPIEISSSVPNVNATLTLSDTAAGNLNEGSNVNATSTFNPGLGRWHAFGNVYGLNALFGNLIFTPSLHYSNDFNISLSITNGNDTITDTVNAFGTSGDPAVSSTGSTALSYNLCDVGTVIDNTLSITDPNGNILQSAKVVMNGDVDLTVDSLEFTDQNGITGTYNDINGELTLLGSATLGDYQTALRSVRYKNSDNSLTDKLIEASFVVNDGIYDSDAAIKNITVGVSEPNCRPVLTANSNPLVYNCGDGSRLIDSAFTISDPNDNTLQSATINIDGDIALDKHSLNFDDQNDISGEYSTSGRELSLTGSADILAYQDAIRSITYEYAGDSNPGVPVTLSFKVNDGLYDSETVTREINFGSCDGSDDGSSSPQNWDWTVIGGTIAATAGVVVTAGICAGTVWFANKYNRLKRRLSVVEGGDQELSTMTPGSDEVVPVQYIQGVGDDVKMEVPVPGVDGIVY